MNIQQCCALYENNNGFPRLLTPHELSGTVVSNVEQRAPTPSSKLLCVRSHLSRNLDIGAAVDTFIVLRHIVFFSLSTQPQFSFSFTCKLLTICCAPFAKLVMHTGDKIHNQHFFWTLCVCDGHIYQTLLLLARYLQDMYITDYLQFSYSALYAAAASFWI